MYAKSIEFVSGFYKTPMFFPNMMKKKPNGIRDSSSSPITRRTISIVRSRKTPATIPVMIVTTAPAGSSINRPISITATPLTTAAAAGKATPLSQLCRYFRFLLRNTKFRPAKTAK